MDLKQELVSFKVAIRQAHYTHTYVEETTAKNIFDRLLLSHCFNLNLYNRFYISNPAFWLIYTRIGFFDRALGPNRPFLSPFPLKPETRRVSSPADERPVSPCCFFFLLLSESFGTYLCIAVQCLFYLVTLPYYRR